MHREARNLQTNSGVNPPQTRGCLLNRTQALPPHPSETGPVPLTTSTRQGGPFIGQQSLLPTPPTLVARTGLRLQTLHPHPRRRLRRGRGPGWTPPAPPTKSPTEGSRDQGARARKPVDYNPQNPLRPRARLSGGQLCRCGHSDSIHLTKIITTTIAIILTIIKINYSSPVIERRENTNTLPPGN